MVLTSQATALAIVQAADAWLLKNLNDQEAIFSSSVNGEAFTVRGYDEVLKVREQYARIYIRQKRGSRTFARFVR